MKRKNERLTVSREEEGKEEEAVLLTCSRLWDNAPNVLSWTKKGKHK
jgi:hypothetical protein